MTRVQRNRARLLLAVLLVFIAFKLLPLVPFVVGAVVVLLVAAFAIAAYWYERAIDAEAERFGAVMHAEGLEIDLEHMTQDYDSTLGRLSEVLDEHALCPAPVEAKPIARKRTVKKTTALKVVGGTKVPAQRNGATS